MEKLLFPHLYLSSVCMPLATGADAAQLQLCCTVYAGFSLRTPGSFVPVEEALQAAGEQLPSGCILDLGLPKQQAEWLAAGHAIAPDGPVRQWAVDIAVGESRRTFLILGDCMDDGAGTVQPAPFTRMPLDWAHTFGGTGCAANPAGKGACEVHGGRPVPNVCTWKARDVLETAHPACPLPMDPCTRPLPSGTFDAAWLASVWPAPPADFDWSWYNLAQEEQRLAQPFTGLEAVHITGMHPEGPLVSTLPGQRLRVFAEYAAEASPQRAGWYEMQAVADTVWLFPEAALGLQLWHVLCPCTDERATDIATLAVCYEDARGVRHSLEELLQQRTALVTAQAEPADAAAPAAAAAEPAPPAAPAAPPDMPAPQAAAPDRMPEHTPVQAAVQTAAAAPQAVPAAAQLLSDLSEETRKALPQLLETINPVLREHGLPELTLADMEAQLAKQSQGMQQALAAMEEQEAVMQDTDAMERLVLQPAGMTRQDLDNIMEAVALTPPVRADFADAEAWHAALEAYGDRFAALTRAPASVRDNLVQQLRALGEQALATPEPEPSSAELSSLLAQSLQAAGLPADADKISTAFAAADTVLGHGPAGDAALLAVMQNVACAMGIDPALGTAQITKQLSALRSALYADEELHTSLRALLAQHAVPEEAAAAFLARLSEGTAQISPDPVPAPAAPDLAAQAKACGLASPELLADLAALDPLPATVPDTVQNAETGADTASGTGSAPTQDSGADTGREDDAEKDSAQGRDGSSTAEDTDPGTDTAVPVDVPAGVMDFSGQHLVGMHFAGCNLAGAIFEGATLHECDFSGCQLTGARFAGADLSGSCFQRACLDGADLTDCVLRGTDFAGARARDAIFSGCLFAQTCCTGLDASAATFAGTQAASADLGGCQLDGAIFTAADLSHASFARAALRAATFEHCSLAGADFQGACLESARLYFSNLDAANLFRVQAADSNWLSCTARGLVLTRAELTRATFETCQLYEGQCAAISARECRFLSCTLHACDLRRADLLSGALRDCHLTACDVRFASLFGADLLFLTLDAATRLTDANLARTALTRSPA